MIRENDRQTRLTDKFSFAVFCLSVIASAIGYGIWGFLWIPIFLLAAAVAFLASPRFVAKIGTTVLASVLWGSAFLVSAAVSEETDFLARARFFEIAVDTELPLIGNVTAVRSSGFDAEIRFVGENLLDISQEMRFYAPVDRLSPDEEVRVSKWKKITVTGRKSPMPEFRADEVEILKNGSSSATALRKWLADRVDALFPRKESWLARGILFWDGTGISDEEYSTYRTSGLSHLVVASWWNVAVVAGIIAIFAKRLSYIPRVATLLFGIWGYALLAGSGIPVVRAAIMASMATLAEPVFKADPVAVLLTVGAAMALYDPSMGSNASFLLSFSATLWMCAFAPKMAENLTFVPKSIGIKETAVATLAATVATMPVTVGVFSSFPLLSILSNVATIPILAYAAIPTLVAIPFEAVGFDSLASAIASIGYSALSWTNFVASGIAQIPWATVSPLGKTESAITAASWAAYLTAVSFRTLLRNAEVGAVSEKHRTCCISKNAKP